MKTIMIVSSILMFGATSLFAQSESGTGKDEKEVRREALKTERETKRNERALSFQVKGAFMRDFPNATNVNWKAGKTFEEATFTAQGITMTAYYDVDNELVGTTTEKTFNDIPLVAQERIKRSYKGYTPDQVILFDDNETNEMDMVLYDSPFEDEDNYFVSLKNDKETIVLKSDMSGSVSFFKKL